MRIGIWCDYGKTLVPSEGIGVFTHDLARNLVKAVDCEVLLVAAAGDGGLLRGMLCQGEGRIQVVESPETRGIKKFLLKQMKSLRWKKLYASGSVATLFDRMVSLLTMDTNRKVETILSQADVWILPHVRFEHRIQKPTVVCVHDLIPYHYPEMMKAHKLREFKAIVRQVVDGSCIAACMSNFIKENDLIGQLQLPEKKIRVIRASIPDDVMSNSLPTELNNAIQQIDSLLDSRYLLYPAAFRLYKNHILLIRALRILKDRTDCNWKVVFTGIQPCPDYIQEELRKQQLENEVVILRHVTRGGLTHLYRNAFATVVPSLYEQGSYPLMEALSLGCPIMSSDIPSLREHFDQIGKDMLFFDPHDPNHLAATCERLAKYRSQIIESQKAGFENWKSYDGADAARNWYQICLEALEQHAFPKSTYSASAA
jgi:glycosyltransferase involved in cell wall biosynthesis